MDRPAPAAHSQAPETGEPSPWTDAARGVEHPELAALATELWEHRMRSYPVWATRLGDPRYHGALTDISPAGIAERDREQQRFLARLAAIEPSTLSEADRLTRAVFQEELRHSIAARRAGYEPETFEVDPLRGPQVELSSMVGFQPRATPREREQLLERWRAIPAHVEQHIANLRRGLESGRVASRTAIQTVIAQIDEALSFPASMHPLALPAHSKTDGPLEERIEFLRGVLEAIEETGPLVFPGRTADVPLLENRGVRPSMARYRAFLADELLPAARSDEQPGLKYLADGGAHYALLAREHTTLDMDPTAIHAVGLEQVADIRRRMEELGRRALGTTSFVELAERLRSNPALHYSSGEEIAAEARAYLAKAEAAVPAVFGRLPRTPCEVHLIPVHEAPGSTTAYYMPPAADGSRVGRYYVNTFEPHTRPRYEAAALAYHEAVPGHHLQIALAQELTELPLFRRHAGFTAYVEGWALYTELLADELGLYETDLERLGMLSYQAWRACRLVVDTGIHAFGWSRDAAIEYMLDNTLLSRANVENEVDRYIAWPGQALAYMLGRIEIQHLRAQAEERLGERFELAAFHDELLRHGPLPLEVLRGVIERWIGATAERGS